MNDRITRDGPPGSSYLLTINGGSSSLKFALFSRDGEPDAGRVGEGGADRAGGRPMVVADASGGGREEGPVEAPDLARAVEPVIGWVERFCGLAAIAAVGHRVVHGGARHRPEVVDRELLDHLRATAPLDPEHVPGEIAAIEAIGRIAPGLPQVACFDTAFTMICPGSRRSCRSPGGTRRRGSAATGSTGCRTPT
jgi:acetate kinase